MNSSLQQHNRFGPVTIHIFAETNAFKSGIRGYLIDMTTLTHSLQCFNWP